MIPFVHLHVHSQYSILDGMAPIKDLVDKAITDGMRGMALTDHGNMYGIKAFHDYVNKVNQKRQEGDKFKPIFGCEVYVANKDRHDRSDKRDNGNHLILLAKNLQGYKNLIKIVSHAWTEGLYYHPRTDHSELEKYHEEVLKYNRLIGNLVAECPSEDYSDEYYEGLEDIYRGACDLCEAAGILYEMKTAWIKYRTLQKKKNKTVAETEQCFKLEKTIRKLYEENYGEESDNRFFIGPVEKMYKDVNYDKEKK